MRKLSNKDYQKIEDDPYYYEITFHSEYSTGTVTINRTMYLLYEKDFKTIFKDVKIQTWKLKKYNVVIDEEKSNWFHKVYKYEEIKDDD